MNSILLAMYTSTDPSLLRIEQPTTNPDAFRSALVFQRLLVHYTIYYTSLYFDTKIVQYYRFFEMDINL